MEPMFLDDPALFSVWATPDPNSKLAAAKHLAELYKNYLSLAQCYQEVSKAVKLDRRMQVFVRWDGKLRLN